MPGCVRVAVEEGELRLANTGAPLDAAGVSALASLRASAKRDDTRSVGRFGVGFAAVLALTDEPRIVSGPGKGVRFSARDTAAAAAQLPGPAAELARRAGHVPVLRLVWPVEPDEPAPPGGYDTEVRLPLRTGAARDEAVVRALLDAAWEAAVDLLLALPDLHSITVGERTLSRSGDGPVITLGGQRFLLVRRSGAHEESALVAVEDRHRREWSLCWALPLAPATDVPAGGHDRGDTGPGVPRPYPPDAGEVLHAPTATTERLSLPARLIATFPLEPDRRRVRRGAATELLVREAAAAYLELVKDLAPGHRTLLVPEPGFPVSELDGLLREAVLEQLEEGVWLPGAAGGELAPRSAEWLDLPAPGLAGLLAAADPAFERLAALDGGAGVPVLLGLARLTGPALTDRLHAVEAPASWWYGLYDALAPAVELVPGLREELRALPVPLADGRLVTGPHSVLLPEGDLAAEPGMTGLAMAGPADSAAAAVRRLAMLGLPGLHIAHPAAAHPLLARLGAAEADPAVLLAHEALREAVERSVDDAEAGLDTAALATAVLGLLAAVPTGAGRFGALALPDDQGVASRADELMLADAAVRPLLAPDAPIGVLDPEWAARFPREALVAAGVLDGFAVVADDDPAGPTHDLHDEDLWWEERDPERLLGIRDLDLVADDAWPAALRQLAAQPGTREALLAEGGYPGWWIERNALLGGHPPGFWRLPSSSALAGLFDPAPVDVDEAVLAAIGVRAGLGITGLDEADDLLERLSDPARPVHAALAVAGYAALAEAVAAGVVDVDALALPDRVRSLAGAVVPVDRAVVLDAGWTAAVLPDEEIVAGGDPVALAELLDLPLASEVVAGEVRGEGQPVPWSALPAVVVACGVLDVEVPEGVLMLHEELEVTLSRPSVATRSVPAWPDAAGRWHATDPLRALLGHLALIRWQP